MVAGTVEYWRDLIAFRPDPLYLRHIQKGKTKMNNKRPRKAILIATVAVSSILLLSAVILGFAQGKPEVIECTAMGTSTQMGRSFTLKIIIDEYSTEEDRNTVIQAFEKGKNKGLYDALRKLPTRGRIQTPATVGFELKFIRLMPNSPPGTRKINIMSDRPINIGETYSQSRSLDYTLSAVQLDLNEDSKKSTGILLPLCEFKLNKKTKELEIEVRKNPFKLLNFFSQEK